MVSEQLPYQGAETPLHGGSTALQRAHSCCPGPGLGALRCVGCRARLGEMGNPLLALSEGLCNILLIGNIISVKIWLTACQEFSPPLLQLTHSPFLPSTSNPWLLTHCLQGAKAQAPKFPSSPGHKHEALPKSTIIPGSFPSSQNPAPRGSARDAPAHLSPAPGAAAPRGACSKASRHTPSQPTAHPGEEQRGKKNERILNF